MFFLNQDFGLAVEAVDVVKGFLLTDLSIELVALFLLTAFGVAAGSEGKVFVLNFVAGGD